MRDRSSSVLPLNLEDRQGRFRRRNGHSADSQFACGYVQGVKYAKKETEGFQNITGTTGQPGPIP